MLKEIKKIKCGQLNQELIEKQYNQEILEKKDKLNSLRKIKDEQNIYWCEEIQELEQELLDMQKVSKEEWLKNKIMNAKTLKDLKISFEKAVEMLKEKNIPLVLTEEDKIITNNESEFKEMSDLMFVHKTRFFPQNGIIKTSKAAGAYKQMFIEVRIDGKDYEIGGHDERDTIHFTLNTEVEMNSGGMIASLIDGKNNWETMKYTILIPGQEINEKQLIALRGEDSYFKGNITLPKGTIILVPVQEKEKLLKDNPGMRLIGYEGDPKGYGTALLSCLGYKAEKIDQISKKAWANEHDTLKIYELAKEKGKSTLEHWASTEINEENRSYKINCLLNIFLIIKEKIKENPDFINRIHLEKSLLFRIQNLIISGVIIGKENQYNQNELNKEGIEEFLEKLSTIGVKFNDEETSYIKETYTYEQYRKAIQLCGYNIDKAQEVFLNSLIGQIIYNIQQHINEENKNIPKEEIRDVLTTRKII